MSIGINRPQKRNCVNQETAEKLVEAFSDFEMDDNINCAILHGIGGNFSAGYDLSELANIDKDNLANEIVIFLYKIYKCKVHPQWRRWFNS